MDIAGWGDAERRQYSDVMEALSYPRMPTAAWMVLIREVMAALAEGKRKREQD